MFATPLSTWTFQLQAASNVSMFLPSSATLRNVQYSKRLAVLKPSSIAKPSLLQFPTPPAILATPKPHQVTHQMINMAVHLPVPVMEEKAPPLPTVNLSALPELLLVVSFIKLRFNRL